MTDYCTADELGNFIGGAASDDDALVALATTAASRAIDQYCGLAAGAFGRDDSASPRRYRVQPDRSFSPELMYVDDFVPDQDGFEVATDDDNDGTFETVWSTSDYELEPLNPTYGSQNAIRAVGARIFPIAFAAQFPEGTRTRRRAGLQVTAVWGFEAIPEPVHEVALLVGQDLYGAKDAPFGVAGATDFGVLRIRANPMMQFLLRPFDLSSGIG